VIIMPSTLVRSELLTPADRVALPKNREAIPINRTAEAELTVRIFVRQMVRKLREATRTLPA
jgi:hypothetical protein